MPLLLHHPSRARRLPPLPVAALMLAVLGTTMGCALPPHTTGLRHVHEAEIGRASFDLPPHRCTVGAHRGASLAHRENTLAALAAAEADPRFAFVEFDVQYTRDGYIVVYHDKYLLRMHRTLRAVGKADYADLLALTNGEMPLYADVMDTLRKKVNIEIKSQGDDDEDRRLADAIVADIHARGRVRDVMISSISPAVIRYINQRYPEFPTGQVFWLTSSTYLHWDRLTDALYTELAESHADYLMLHVANLRNLEALLRRKPPGKTIMFWDFDDRIYLVHQDRHDRLWGESGWADIWQRLRYALTKDVSSPPSGHPPLSLQPPG